MMSSNTGARSNGTREKKRAEFLDTSRKRRGLKPAFVVILLIVAGLVAYFVIGNSSDRPSSSTVTNTDNSASGASAAGDIKIPVSDLASGKAKFFDYTLPDATPVRFFAVKSPDGTYRAAMDACEVCFHAKKGYRQDGDKMICNNCGLSFEIARIGTIQGGCHPIGVSGALEGDQLVIKASELQSRGQYFQ